MKHQTLLFTFVILFSLAFTSLASALTMGDVTTSPNVVAPGGSLTIEMDLENNGDVDIKDISASLDLTQVPFAPYNSASEYSIDEIKDGRTKSVLFKVIVLNDATSGIYKIPAHITYSEESIIKTKNSLVSVTVNSAPIIDASLEEGLLLKEKENKVSIKIVNKGLSNAKFLEVEIGGGSYTVLSPKNVYIGDIDSNDFDSVEFNIFFKDSASSTITLPITVRYKDSLNKEYSEDFSLQAKVYTTDQAIQLGLLTKNNTTLYILVIVILIIIWIIYRRIKKRRKLKKAASAA